MRSLAVQFQVTARNSVISDGL